MRLVVLLPLQLCLVTTDGYMAIWLQTGRTSGRNTTVFPPCVNDADCQETSDSRGEDYRCFQYMCYPWRRRDTGFRPCRKTSDCLELAKEEGGTGEDGGCWRHSDRRNVHIGLCLDKRETAQCQDHSACSAHLRCVAGHCGDGGYLEALAQQSCQDHHLCHDLLLGPDCCFDIRGGVEKISSGDMSSTWGKKCCDNLWSPITRPPDNLTADVVTKLDQKIHELYTPWGLDAVVCEGLQYDLVTRLRTCQEFTTTTSTTSTTTSTTDRSLDRVTSRSRDSVQGRHGVSGSIRSYHVTALVSLYFVVLMF